MNCKFRDMVCAHVGIQSEGCSLMETAFGWRLFDMCSKIEQKEEVKS